MRDTLRITILALLILGAAAGCSRYDRDLLGDPEPAQPAPPAEVVETVAVQEEAVDPTSYEYEDSLDVGMFADLMYYGSWHWVDPYGWVWRPIVVSEWQPLLYGHWIWTQYGWMWVSYDPWGWATTHYGYWAIDFTFGWIWIPDYTWSPCQCDWVVYDDYICWAPVAPEGVKYKDPWDPDGNPWVAVPKTRFKEPDVGDYRTTPKYKTGYSDRSLRRAPPDEHEIQRGSSKPIQVINVQLDHSIVGDREFARVRLPAEQESIVKSHQAKTKTKSSGSYKYQPPSYQPPSSDDGSSGNVDSGGNKPVKSESKPKAESRPKSESKKDSDSAQGYKERKAEEKRKEEAKKEPKSKPPR